MLGVYTKSALPLTHRRVRKFQPRACEIGKQFAIGHNQRRKLNLRCFWVCAITIAKY